MGDLPLKKFLVIDSSVLPEVFEKVLTAKELLRTNSVKGISEAVKKVDISRSTFYKYKDYVFGLSEGMVGNKAILSFLLKDERGTLSSILKHLSSNEVNILTINQDLPINKIANVSITIEISKMETDIDTLIENLKILNGVVKAELLALE